MCSGLVISEHADVGGSVCVMIVVSIATVGVLDFVRYCLLELIVN